MERKDRILPPTELPRAVESVRGPFVMTLEMHLADMLRSLAGAGGSDSSDPGEMMFDALRRAVEAKQAGLGGLATRFDNVYRVCSNRWLGTNGSGNGTEPPSPSNAS